MSNARPRIVLVEDCAGACTTTYAMRPSGDFRGVDEVKPRKAEQTRKTPCGPCILFSAWFFGFTLLREQDMSNLGLASVIQIEGGPCWRSSATLVALESQMIVLLDIMTFYCLPSSLFLGEPAAAKLCAEYNILLLRFLIDFANFDGGSSGLEKTK